MTRLKDVATIAGVAALAVYCVGCIALRLTIDALKGDSHVPRSGAVRVLR